MTSPRPHSSPDFSRLPDFPQTALPSLRRLATAVHRGRSRDSWEGGGCCLPVRDPHPPASPPHAVTFCRGLRLAHGTAEGLPRPLGLTEPRLHGTKQTLTRSPTRGGRTPEARAQPPLCAPRSRAPPTQGTPAHPPATPRGLQSLQRRLSELLTRPAPACAPRGRGEGGGVCPPSLPSLVASKHGARP